MAIKTFTSKYVSTTPISSSQLNDLFNDIELYNRIKWTAASMQGIRDTSARKPKKGPDLRKAENRHLKTGVSDHCTIKRHFGVDDYFAASAITEAKASIQSAKELKAYNIDQLKGQLKDLKAKRTTVKSRLTRLSNIKEALIKASKDIAAGKEPDYNIKGAVECYDPKTGCFNIMRRGRVVKSYSNAYLFELKYIDPGIKRLKNTLDRLDEREALLRQRIKKNQDSGISICYGTKKFFRRQDDETRYPDHEVWLKAFRKKRSSSLLVIGRHDAAYGNFRAHYDTVTHTLVYMSQSKRPVIIPNVEFPYGQDLIDAAVNADPADRGPVTWRIKRTGENALSIQCMIHVGASDRINTYYGDGCISMDSNYDNLSVCELDRCGNVLHHRVIHFDPEKLTSEQYKNILSLALDIAFKWCDRSHKPFAMENLKLKKVTDHYGGKKRNRHTSLFAFKQITTLAESKAMKHEVDIIKVRPAYTSQQGKLRYVKKYGMSIHEGASAAIGRRAMKKKISLPDVIRKQLPHDKQKKSVFQQWKDAYRITKKLTAGEMYGYEFA